MTIVVATDLSERGRPLVDLAGALADKRSEPLVIVHVADGPFVSKQRERLAAEEVRLRGGAGVVVESMLELGPPIGVRIADIAADRAATLIVVGAQRAVLGGPVAELLHRSGLPVLVVRDAEALMPFAGGAGIFAMACVALDDSDAGLSESLSFLAGYGTLELELAHLADAKKTRATEREVADAAAPMPAGVVPLVVVCDGADHLDRRLAERAAQQSAELVVCGSHRRHGLDRILGGSIAEGIVKRASTSVLVARCGPGTPSSS